MIASPVDRRLLLRIEFVGPRASSRHWSWEDEKHLIVETFDDQMRSVLLRVSIRGAVEVAAPPLAPRHGNNGALVGYVI